MGLTGICFYSYSSVQLHKKWSVELFSENCSYSYIKNGFRIKNVMISKRMVMGRFLTFTSGRFPECFHIREEKGTQTQIFGPDFRVGWGSSTSTGGRQQVRYVL